MVISTNLLNEIDEKREKILANPSLELKLRKKTDKRLRRFCNLHSYFIEHPSERMKLLRKEHVEDAKALKAKVNGYTERANACWEHLSLNYPNGLLPNLNPNIIFKIGNMVDPTNISFRSSGLLRLNDMKYVPPNPLKVNDLIDKYCRDINGSEYHPVEAAALTHLVITGIQPFKDGNKRTARILQDKILFDYKLPPAFFPYGEREVYLDLLDQSLLDKMSGNSQNFVAQRPFFDYVGGKVNAVLDEVLGDIR